MELLNPMADANFPARTVTYTGTAGSTSTWPAGPQGVVVWSDQACYVIVGEGVTATTSNGTPISCVRGFELTFQGRIGEGDPLYPSPPIALSLDNAWQTIFIEPI